MALQDLQKERKKKLRNIQRLGINPYPSYAKATAGKPARIEIFRARKLMGKKVVVVAGRIRSLRPHGKITFADIEDASGKIQLLFRQDSLLGEKYDFLSNRSIHVCCGFVIFINYKIDSKGPSGHGLLLVVAGNRHYNGFDRIKV